MNLRQWQRDCLEHAIEHYRTRRHYLCLATPGAGKTVLATEVANHMVKAGMVDYVLCFSPSVVVALDFRDALECRLNARFDGQIGARGWSMTYQAMLTISPQLWKIIEEYRVLVIFDEIHHCAGSEMSNANAWGATILQRIRCQASYTLSLTGTPWRSDQLPIVLSQYSNEDLQIRCDYTYGMLSAIDDGVCRLPQITVVDNDCIKWISDQGSSKVFTSIEQLLSHSSYSYHQLIEHPSIVEGLLELAQQKLFQLRKVNPRAGGLIVASSVSHAEYIRDYLQSKTEQPVVLVTYQESESASLITQFKNNDTPWIVSVGMISEGTNIPRLQVCCHLTRIKTELHYRQILGRVLRRESSQDLKGYLFTLAEPTLIAYAKRIAEDLPEARVVHKQKQLIEPVLLDESPQGQGFGESIDSYNPDSTPLGDLMVNSLTSTRQTSLQSGYYQNLRLYGRYRSEVISLRQSYLN
ncbi:DEAD/DEAH box helicase family protein [Hahella aquimaris]|uniref:DEAD/DEAH box helicase n=1 Tax=Hahella sp. HNIBRBA332 TaxID=3015983 RepID=UPI00273C06B9|nr:DEAD/DEAH box helicase family protein [Hahella sp. HNIBRBA332]WLQ16806.1 DEAD/DEAH box helicase family protein [Hahella sp. HNIBRBA332]